MKNEKQITVTRWIFNQKTYDFHFKGMRYEMVDGSELKNGLPVNMKEAVVFGTIEKETEKAIQVYVACDELERAWVWFPKSQIIKIEDAA